MAEASASTAMGWLTTGTGSGTKCRAPASGLLAGRSTRGASGTTRGREMARALTTTDRVTRARGRMASATARASTFSAMATSTKGTGRTTRGMERAPASTTTATGTKGSGRQTEGRGTACASFRTGQSTGGSGWETSGFKAPPTQSSPRSLVRALPREPPGPRRCLGFRPTTRTRTRGCAGGMPSAARWRGLLKSMRTWWTTGTVPMRSSTPRSCPGTMSCSSPSATTSS
mmetsp:Transcript_14254/g.40451  ORF Transcript_14254/g.40451 Transcript_14254/m.40451 type:complete len:230 (+) Transcript_14254:924-1613(+)